LLASRAAALSRPSAGGVTGPALDSTTHDRQTADQAGWSSDALEAQAFAYLAVRTLNDLPITFPKTTDAPKPLAGGVVARP